MPTYRLSARNQFRSPSGAVGEAPDGPGALAALADDIDNRLGVGGAEYCATPAARDAIPTSRCFTGKLAYVASEDSTYRYSGGTWGVWSTPWIQWTPVVPGGGFTLGNGSYACYYRVVGKAVEFSYKLTIGSTSGFGTYLAFKMPFGTTPFNSGVQASVGSATIVDVSTGPDRYIGNMFLIAVDIIQIDGVGPSAGKQSGITATSPLAFAAPDTIGGAGRYILA